MKQLGVLILALPCWCSLADAQTANPSPRFDAASVKPAEPFVPGADYRLRGGPGTESPGQIDYPRVTLFALIMRAYDVGGDQVSCPEWMATEQYSVHAKVPGNTTKEDFQLMLQGLLSDRFHLTFHHVTKEAAGYELVIANGGHKMKPAPAEAEPPAAAPTEFHPMKLDANGFPERRPGTPGSTMMSGGMVRSRERVTMEQLANELPGAILMSTGAFSVTMGAMPPRPRVADKTGLTGKFDFTLEYAGSIPLPGNLPIFANRPPPDPSALPAASDPAGAGGPSIFTAVEKQLGLKLVKTKNVPLDVLVIDRADKVPTDN